MSWVHATVGTVAGLVLGAGASNRWGQMLLGITEGPLITLIAGLGGALIGGVISFAVAYYNNRNIRLAENRDRSEVEEARAVRSIFTAKHIADRIYTLNRTLDQARVAADLMGGRLVQSDEELNRQIRVLHQSLVDQGFFDEQEDEKIH